MNAPSFPSLLQRFFTERLLNQLGASSHTVASYRDTFRLLLRLPRNVPSGRLPTSACRISTHLSWESFWSISNGTDGTPSGPETIVSPRFTRSFGMCPSVNRQLPSTASASWRSPPSDTIADQSSFSQRKRPPP
jgi:hypothetical protein